MGSHFNRVAGEHVSECLVGTPPELHSYPCRVCGLGCSPVHIAKIVVRLAFASPAFSGGKTMYFMPATCTCTCLYYIRIHWITAYTVTPAPAIGPMDCA